MKAGFSSVDTRSSRTPFSHAPFLYKEKDSLERNTQAPTRLIVFQSRRVLKHMNNNNEDPTLAQVHRALVHDLTPVHLRWGAPTATERGPLVCSTLFDTHRNCVGAHSGPYCVYRALSIASGDLSPAFRPDYQGSHPAVKIGPHPQWQDATKASAGGARGHSLC